MSKTRKSEREGETKPMRGRKRSCEGFEGKGKG